jgi:hypothetical protein
MSNNLSNQKEESFWSNLKQLLIKEYCKNQYIDVGGYYELLRKSDVMNQMAEESKFINYSFSYYEDMSGYTNGYVDIKSTSLNYIYKIELGFQLANESESGVFLNEIIPLISIAKIENLYHDTFEGKYDEYIEAQENMQKELEIHRQNKIKKEIENIKNEILEKEIKLKNLLKEIA